MDMALGMKVFEQRLHVSKCIWSVALEQTGRIKDLYVTAFTWT
jgi:hypothetical protein